MKDDAGSSLGGVSRPLQGATAWLITDEKIGMLVQCRGVADALGVEAVHKQVAPRGLWRVLSPWAGPAPAERMGKPGSAFAPPWPDIAIATGRLSIPYLRRLRRLAGPRTFTVVLQDPKTGLGTADLIWVPAHDRLRGDNVVTTLTSAHSFPPARLAGLRARMPEAIAALPPPRITVVLGGTGGGYTFADADMARLAGALASLARSGASFLVTPSRRTPPTLLEAVDRATAGAPRILWRGDGPNPYPDFLAHADALIVTADSVNMTGEACATGRPVYVFFPSAGAPKFQRFHAALEKAGATRPLPDAPARLDAWTYQLPDAAAAIAAEIERRWLARC
ncbi:MAG: mitochondrial fission ELM1 family protein [Hyphomicrobiaceae bacterium]|nr:mitochondrial fission ELM1 family protein [Hyphomicrobiaceae bacterium]